MKGFLCAALISALGYQSAAFGKDIPPLPHLESRHGATQLIVDDHPYLMRAGELENSTPSDLRLMEATWPKLEAMHFNTAVVPAYWEIIEPKEGHFDFRSVDGLVAGARRHNMRLVLLWFGSWKNSMSSYVPAWVKWNTARFPRARRSDGSSIEILSAVSSENLRTDGNAFAALMAHLKAFDGGQHTVVVVQVENEIGMIPEARDHSPEAEAAFRAPVPAQLTDYLAAHKDSLQPDLLAAWKGHGLRTGGSWSETFGDSVWTDELFNAWTEALYTGKVAARGKAIYPLPMNVNAALVRPGRKPGEYPSGGPLPHLFDIWKAAAPSIDFLSPDLYFPNFTEWADKYVRPDNLLFIPETGRVSVAAMSANAAYAFAHLNAMGFSPYAPDYFSADEMKALGEAYAVLGELGPLISANQGTPRLQGFTAPAAFDGTANLSPQKFSFGPYIFEARFKMPPSVSTGQQEEKEIPGAHGGLIVQMGPDEFYVAGTGTTITFASTDMDRSIAGIEMIEDGHFAGGRWVRGRVLNGDDNNQGRNLRLPSGQFTIRHVRLYRYR
jgi:beta-galactosidase GanA